MYVAIAAFMLGVGQPAAAKSEASCILDRIPAADRPQIARDALAGSPVGGASRTQVDMAVDACIDQMGWDAEQSGTMAGLALATLLRDDAAARLSRAGVPTRSIDAWFEGQSVAIRTNPEIDQAVGGTLIFSLMQSGVTEPTLEAVGETIGNYVGARIMIERAQRGLPLD